MRSECLDKVVAATLAATPRMDAEVVAKFAEKKRVPKLDDSAAWSP